MQMIVTEEAVKRSSDFSARESAAGIAQYVEGRLLAIGKTGISFGRPLTAGLPVTIVTEIYFFPDQCTVG